MFSPCRRKRRADSLTQALLALLAFSAGGRLHAEAFRICAEPDNLSMSQESTASGFEIETARILAAEMGQPLAITWLAQRDHAYFRQTIGKGHCDAIMEVLGPDLYNQFFTMHGTAMMFLFAVPMVEGMMIYLVPLMVGSRIIAFPRLNAFSYWVYLFGGLFIWFAFFINSGPDAGWFSYPPLAGPEFSPGKRVDVYAQMITFTELAALAVAVEIIVTILKFRAPGMTPGRMPVFLWASLVTCLMIVWSMPAVVTTSTFLILDRLVGTHFFNPAEGGDALLWQHLYWYFAHPEVYIIFLPSVGLASHVIETFCRRPIFGYPAIVLSLVAQGILSFGLWVHHMYATGLPRVGSSFFEASSLSIAIPSGTFIFCWLATIATGRIRLAVPMLWIVSFFIIFLLGGFSGVMLGSVPLDLQITDTYALPSHLHLVLIGGAVAPLIAAWWFWFPKFTGRVLDEKLGYWQWALFLLGSLMTFIPMFLLGLSGMTRRVYTYSHAMGWDLLNLLASIGAWSIGLRGTQAFMVIEGLAFAFAFGIATYLYLYNQNKTWPLGPQLPLLWPILMSLVMPGIFIIEFACRGSRNLNLRCRHAVTLNVAAAEEF
jgi:cytochrome c oxidase subunit 1